MHVDLAKDWPAFIIMAVFVWFLVYLIVSGRKSAHKDESASAGQRKQ